MFHIKKVSHHQFDFYNFSITTWRFAAKPYLLTDLEKWELLLQHASFWIYLHKIFEILQLQARRLLIYCFTQHNENKGWTSSLTTMTWFKLVIDQSKVHPVFFLIKMIHSRCSTCNMCMYRQMKCNLFWRCCVLKPITYSITTEYFSHI